MDEHALPEYRSLDVGAMFDPRDNDISRSAELDCLLALTCRSLGVPSALVTIADGDDQWSYARGTSDADLSPGVRACCDLTMTSGRIVVVSDTRLDGRFRTAFHDVGRGDVRFFAGMPLVLEAGRAAGTLSILDERPRNLTEDQTRCLLGLADLATSIIRRHRDTRALANANRKLAEQAVLLREQAAELEHSKKLFERSSAVAKIGVWECDLTAGDALRWTNGVYDLFELPRGSAITREQILKFYPPESLVEMETVRSRAIRERGGFSLDVKITTAKGNERWMRLTANVECENGAPVRIFGMKQDITDEKRLWEQTRYLAECDVLTGLSNRSRFQAELSDACNTAAGQPSAGALLLVDLDGFKQINDVFGHALGDECLRQIASRLRALCRDAELVARIGGDEFAILIDRPTERASVEALAAAIIEALRPPVEWGGNSFQISASIGVALNGGTGSCDPVELFTQADIALYAAKAAGKNTFRSFEPQMKSDGDRRFEAVREVAGALLDDRLDLYFQPKVSLSDRRLAGFEALLRRRLPDGQIVPAGAFKDAFQDPDLAARLGNLVTEKALRQAGQWHRAGLDFGAIAVNVGSSQVHDPRFAEKLMERIAEHGLAPRMIEIEIPESVFVEGASLVRPAVERLRNAGLRITLDDFGSGHASLVHLRRYPVDGITIDASFVRSFMTVAADRAILAAILQLGASLGIDVVAEGIETASQLEGLKALGCKYGQGYIFSRALPASEALDWLNQRASAPNRTCAGVETEAA